MKQIILPTILEFTRLVNDGFMKENSLAKKGKLGSPIQKVPKKFKLFPAPNYKTHKHTHTHTIRSHEKNICGCGGVYAMENLLV